jgi:hypothetical protein
VNEQRGKKKKTMETMNTGRPWGIILVASLMILFGLAEVVTGVTHNFFGVTTANAPIFAYSAATIGTFYIVAGMLTLTMRKWAAALAIVLLGADVVGRVALVVGGLYPTGSLENTLAIIGGTGIAVIFAIYTGWKWKIFT